MDDIRRVYEQDCKLASLLVAPFFHHGIPHHRSTQLHTGRDARPYYRPRTGTLGWHAGPDLCYKPGSMPGQQAPGA